MVGANPEGAQNLMVGANSGLAPRLQAEAAPQLEPRSRHSVTLRAPAKPRNPAYPQPLRILVLVQDSGIRPTGDRVLISADRRALDRRQPTCCPQVGLLDAEFLRV